MDSQVHKLPGKSKEGSEPTVSTPTLRPRGFILVHSLERVSLLPRQVCSLALGASWKWGEIIPISPTSHPIQWRVPSLQV